MGASDSKIYPNCECMKMAKNDLYNSVRCMSTSGHRCICARYVYEPPYNHFKYCQAEIHKCICKYHVPANCRARGHPCTCKTGVCIAEEEEHECSCIKRGPLHCKAVKIKHSCSCENNYKYIYRNGELENCKATEEHFCLCEYDKSYCQACH